MAVDIKYNGNNIASLEGGKTAIIKCAGKKMKSDLTVTAPEDTGGGGGESVLGWRKFNDFMINTKGLPYNTGADQDNETDYLSNPPDPIICDLYLNFANNNEKFLKGVDVKLYTTLVDWNIEDSGYEQLDLYVYITGGIVEYRTSYITDSYNFDGETLGLIGSVIYVKDAGRYTEWLLANTEPATQPDDSLVVQ